MDYRSCMRLFRVVSAAAAVVLCASAVFVRAQTRVLREISFAGAPAYSQAELLAFTGLKPGGSATQQQVEDAAQRLNDTGLFDEVNFAGNDKGIVYTLKPAAASAMLPVRFGNFVWWQDDEIDQALKARVALYHQNTVPTAGNMRDSIAAALTALLTEKGVTGATVLSRLSSSRVNGPLDGIVFAIDSPRVLIRSLTLVDASAGMQTKLARVVQDVAGAQWDKDGSYDNIQSRVSDIYRNDGYLDIAVAKQEHSAPVVSANRVELDVTTTLKEGARYHVNRLGWAGSPMLSRSDFTRLAPLKVGDPASPAALREALHVLTNAYEAKGYLDAQVLAPPTIDRTAHQVAYTISVIDGPQYRFKSVRWPSISEPMEKSFDGAWQMKPGDVYDAGYIVRFLAQNSPFARQGYVANIALKRNSSDLTVDLTVTFTKNGTPH
jgi:outer membrane protein insertion porin family